MTDIFPARTPNQGCQIRYFEGHLCDRHGSYYCPECKQYRCAAHVYGWREQQYRCAVCGHSVEGVPQ